MKYEKHTVRVSKGKDFIMVDLLSADGKTTTSTEPLGGIVLSKEHWKELKEFIKQNPEFEEDLIE